MLFNEPKLLKYRSFLGSLIAFDEVSVLFNEPKLLKSVERVINVAVVNGFSALQRAEIAEIAEVNYV